MGIGRGSPYGFGMQTFLNLAYRGGERLGTPQPKEWGKLPFPQSKFPRTKCLKSQANARDSPTLRLGFPDQFPPFCTSVPVRESPGIAGWVTTYKVLSVYMYVHKPSSCLRIWLWNSRDTYLGYIIQVTLFLHPVRRNWIGGGKGGQ